MGTREVGVIVCGAITGIIIGASAVSISRSVSLDASILGGDTVAFRELPAGQPLIRGRDVDSDPQPLDIPNYPTAKDAVEKSVKADTDPKVCETVKSVVSEVASAHKRIYPENIKQTEAHSKFRATLDAIVEKHCPVEEAASSSSAATTEKVKAKRVNNVCRKYAVGTARYVECKLSEELGKIYKGW